jgi:chromosome partitioning protein
MGSVIAFLNQKGGVGKTTSLLTVAAILAARGKKVLVVDTDGQGNATSRLLGAASARDRPHVFDLLVDEDGTTAPATAVYPARAPFKGVYVLAGDKRLAGVEAHISSRYGRDGIVKRILEPLVDSFDFVLIDNPPSLNLLTMNSLVAASESGGYVVPVDMSADAAEGAKAVRQMVQLMKKNGLATEPTFLGVLICQFQKANAIAVRETMGKLAEEYGEKLLPVKIPHTVKVTEAGHRGEAVCHVDPENAASKAYIEFTDYLIEAVSRKSSASGKRRSVKRERSAEA